MLSFNLLFEVNSLYWELNRRHKQIFLLAKKINALENVQLSTMIAGLSAVHFARRLIETRFFL